MFWAPTETAESAWFAAKGREDLFEQPVYVTRRAYFRLGMEFIDLCGLDAQSKREVVRDYIHLFGRTFGYKNRERRLMRFKERSRVRWVPADSSQNCFLYAEGVQS